MNASHQRLTVLHNLSRAIAVLAALLSFLAAASTPAGAGALVADHNAVREFGRIPTYWLERAKALAIHYSHTSHGSQIMSGLGVLMALDPKYAVTVRNAWDDPDWPPPSPPAALRIFDGQPAYGDQAANDYVTPDLYWESADGIARTRHVAGLGRYTASMWAFCGQMSYYEPSAISTYLQVLADQETAYPSMRFIYQTGHTDGGSEQWKSNTALVRRYVQEHGKVLFDFADIETHDPDGTAHPDMTDACEWCDAWCAAHPGACDFELGDCAHTHKLQCLQKAKAMWWLAARLAGWPGPSAAMPAISTLLLRPEP